MSLHSMVPDSIACNFVSGGRNADNVQNAWKKGGKHPFWRLLFFNILKSDT